MLRSHQRSISVDEMERKRGDDCGVRCIYCNRHTSNYWNSKPSLIQYDHPSITDPQPSLPSVVTGARDTLPLTNRIPLTVPLPLTNGVISFTRCSAFGSSNFSFCIWGEVVDADVGSDDKKDFVLLACSDAVNGFDVLVDCDGVSQEAEGGLM
jgi:hypothetical protein